MWLRETWSIMPWPAPGYGKSTCGIYNISGMDSLEVTLILDQAFDIAVRAGLHCSPDARRALETLEKGTIRLSLGYFNNEEEVGVCLEALASIAGEVASKE